MSIFKQAYKIRYYLALVLLAVAGLMNLVTAEAQVVIHETDEIVVKLHPSVAVDEINATYGTTTMRPLLNNARIYLLQAADGATAEAIVQAMTMDTRLSYVELNYTNAAPEANSRDIYAWPQGGANPPTTPPHILYEWQWGGPDSVYYTLQPAVHAVNLASAQALGQGDGITVAVLDTGVDLSHPVLAGHLVQGYDFIDDDLVPEDMADGLDNDGNGFVDEVVGHGTHIAGIVHRVAPQAQLMPLRVLDSDGQGNIFVVAEALLYAADQGAQVINMSLGTPRPSLFLQDVLQQVTADGVLVVAAAGNLNADIPQYPAASPCVLGVSAVDQGRVKSAYASYGAWVDLVAPGNRVYSTYPGGGYAWWKGTSMATPFVAGQAALLRSLYPSLAPHQIASLIAGTAYSVEQQNHKYANLLGAGRLDIGRSVDALLSGSWPTNAPTPLADCGA